MKKQKGVVLLYAICVYGLSALVGIAAFSVVTGYGQDPAPTAVQDKK